MIDVCFDEAPVVGSAIVKGIYDDTSGSHMRFSFKKEDENVYSERRRVVDIRARGK
jgi:hypothetical protein